MRHRSPSTACKQALRMNLAFGEGRGDALDRVGRASAFRASLHAEQAILSPLAAGLAMTHLFNARRKDMLWIMLICVITSLAAFLGGKWLGSNAD